MTAVELKRAQSQLEEERKTNMKIRAEAAASSCELSIMRVELDTKTGECKKLQEKAAESYGIVLEEQKWLKIQLEEERKTAEKAAESYGNLLEEQKWLTSQLEEERKTAVQARAEASAASCEVSTMRVELDAITAECQRLQDKVAESSGITLEEFKHVQSQLEEERKLVAHARAEVFASSFEAVAQAKTEAAASPPAAATSAVATRCAVVARPVAAASPVVLSPVATVTNPAASPVAVGLLAEPSPLSCLLPQLDAPCLPKFVGGRLQYVGQGRAGGA